jgi:hypothetical protein
MEKIDILLRFAPNQTDQELDLAREYVKLASVINNTDVDSREKTIAIERLEESYMWAKKGLMSATKENYEEDFFGDTI